MLRTPSILLGACLLAESTLAQTESADIGFTDATYPVVITPTRLRQSLADVPASVSVIAAETIRSYGIQSIPDALRLVPGMAVTHATGPDWQISYHGTNTLTPRRMNVLIDGVSVYGPAFSGVDWSQLPLAIDDIDRIEVTRGPNSAAYGPNSMLAVVNIITKNPADVERAYASLSAGSQSSAEATFRGAMRLGDSTSLSLTANRAQDSGYDHVAQDASGHNGLRVNRLNIRSHSRIGESVSLDLQASVAQGTAQIPFVDNFQVSYPDKRFEDSYLGAAWTQQLSPNHELRVRTSLARQQARQNWHTCLPTVSLLPQLFDLWRANPRYVELILAGQMPSGGTPQDDALAAAALVAIAQLGPRAFSPTCVTANQDALQTRTDLEVQDTYVVSDRLRLVGGLGARVQRGDSQTYLGGSRTSAVQWIFGNLEARPWPWLTLNAGGYAEHDSLSPSTFSPRVAANFHLSEQQTLRIVVSKGTRSPDIQEQLANWTYTFTDLAPPLNGASVGRLFQSRILTGGLVNERISSREVGYLLNLPRYGLLLDARVFDDELTSLISERTNLIGLTPTNNGAVGLRGLEAQASMRWTPRWQAFLNYAYLDNHDATNELERSQYSRHSGSLGLHHDLGQGWSGSLAYAGSSGNGFQESHYGRLDLTLSKTGGDEGTLWTATLGLRRLDSPLTVYSIGDVDPLFSRYSSRLQFFAQLSLRLP